jgi:hypothetical protein
MIFFKAILFLLLILVSFSHSEDRYKNRIFNVMIKRNVVYKNDVPFLQKKHMISSLMSGLDLPSEECPVLSFFQNSSDIQKKELRLDLYEPIGDTVENRPLVVVVHGGGFIAGEKKMITLSKLLDTVIPWLHEVMLRLVLNIEKGLCFEIGRMNCI